MSEVHRADIQALRGELRRDESMARHTSWRAGGHVDRAYTPADLADLQTFIATLPHGEPVYFVGLGSNLLVRDGGLKGTVIFTHGALSEINVEDTMIDVQAGVASPKLARYAAMHGLSGAEFMAGIPGTVGGALAMNAGCYGGETWTQVENVTTLSRAGLLHTRSRSEYQIGYRSVVANTGINEEWFVSARFKLVHGDGEKSRAAIKKLLEQRLAAQPLGTPNAGSVFRNPPGDYAARLIQACGLKGYMRGGAMISDKHANFIINVGSARAVDIEALINIARSEVFSKFGVALECEVRIVGEAADE